MLTAAFRMRFMRLLRRHMSGQRGGFAIRLLLVMVPLLLVLTPVTSSWLGVLVGQIAREGARMAPAVDGWLGMDAVRGKAILQQTLPAMAEVGPDPPPRFGWRHVLRSWLYVVLGYDMSQPQTLVLAAMPYGLYVPAPERPTEFAGEKQEPEPVADRELPSSRVIHASTTTLAKLQNREWGREPLVLIFHTHTSEIYASSEVVSSSPQQYHRFNTADTGVVRVGEALARTLSERYGIPVLHSKAIHDFPSYTQSYQRAAVTVQQLLQKYPSIRLVLDVHRDGAQNVSFVRDIGAQKMAQVMVVVTKPVSYSERLHPRWSENIHVANVMKKSMNELYPGLLRSYPVVGSNRYNQHLHPHMVLLEIGNYIDDEQFALRSAALMADVVAMTLHDLPSVSVRASALITQPASSVPSASEQKRQTNVQPPVQVPVPGTRRP